MKDCKVKQSLMASAKEQQLWGVKTKKEVAKAKKEADQVAKQQKADRRARAAERARAEAAEAKLEAIRELCEEAGTRTGGHVLAIINAKSGP